MKNTHRILAAMLLMAVSCGIANAQFYTSRKHDKGTDTLNVYNSWKSLYFTGPDTVAINPNIEVYSPFKFKFKPTEKDNKALKKMIEKQSAVVSIADSVWFVNSHYLKDNFVGTYNKYLEEYMPLYFNEKIMFFQFLPTEISYLYTEVDDFEGLSYYTGVGEEALYDTEYYGLVAVPHFLIDLDNKAVFLVDKELLLLLLEQYPDMKRRYEMMGDQDELYMVNQFFWDYVKRLSSDPSVAPLPIEKL